MDSLFAKEKNWYCIYDKSLLRIVLKDNTDGDFGYIILGPDEDDAFRAIKTMVSYETMQDAEDVLLEIMKKISIDGKSENTFCRVDENTVHESKIIITDINEDVKKYFMNYPEKLHQLFLRKFEVLIASIMQDLGFNVELTKATRDRGKDIIATINNEITSFLIFIECKKYSSDNKIGVEIIRNVSGVHYLRMPSKSILVTTSFFTKDAIIESRMLENRPDLKDFNDIKEVLIDIKNCA